MYKDKRIIAIIPARCGSKGLAHKNIRSFAGKPLMAWTIRCAMNSGLFDEITVSTDSAYYADIARAFGASVPFLRPSEIASDQSPASEYILHALRSYRERFEMSFDYFALLQPTSPLRTSEHIYGALSMAIDGGFSSVVSFSPFSQDLRLVFELPDDLSLDAIASVASPNDTQRQDHSRPLYRVNGMLYVSLCSAYEKTRSFYGADSRAFIADSRYAVDIDSEQDFLYAEYLFKQQFTGY